jgi:alkylated DNA repair protein (DNA oxidative demethylase)
MATREYAPGAIHLPAFLAIADQRALASQCQALVDGDVPAYVPVVRGGGKMHVRMLCLGRHWNGLSYQYEKTRSDFDGREAPVIPDNLARLARDIATAAGMTVEPDVCIVNYYDDEGRMGLHQDKDEGPRSLADGWPVVSVSIGDTARFLFGGLRRRDPARLRFHGVSRIVPCTAPGELAMSGRFNLTFRQSDGSHPIG